MKYFLLLLMLGCLTGCEPNPLSKAKQNYSCLGHGGVFSYTTNSITDLTCRDGKVIEGWRNIIIPLKDLEEMYKIGEEKL